MLDDFWLTVPDCLARIWKETRTNYDTLLTFKLYLLKISITIEQCASKMQTNVYFNLKTSGGNSSNLYLNVVHFSISVLIRHLWKLMTLVFCHWCMICTVQISKHFYLGRFCHMYKEEQFKFRLFGSLLLCYLVERVILALEIGEFYSQGKWQEDRC